MTGNVTTSSFTSTPGTDVVFIDNVSPPRSISMSTSVPQLSPNNSSMSPNNSKVLYTKNSPVSGVTGVSGTSSTIAEVGTNPIPAVAGIHMGGDVTFPRAARRRPKSAALGISAVSGLGSSSAIGTGIINVPVSSAYIQKLKHLEYDLCGLVSSGAGVFVSPVASTGTSSNSPICTQEDYTLIRDGLQNSMSYSSYGSAQDRVPSHISHVKLSPNFTPPTSRPVSRSGVAQAADRSPLPNHSLNSLNSLNSPSMKAKGSAVTLVSGTNSTVRYSTTSGRVSWTIYSSCLQYNSLLTHSLAHYLTYAHPMNISCTRRERCHSAGSS